MTKIVEMRAENYRRLRAVEIRPDGNVVAISGRNGQGKTSLLNAIAVALGGKDLAPKQPIRAGQDRAEIAIQLSDGIKVRRRFRRTESGDTESDLRVEVDGRDRAKPQAFLSELVGSIAFDPLAFMREPPAAKAMLLRQLVAGVDFAAIDKANKNDAEERTAVGREARQARAASEAIALPPGKPPQPVDSGALVKEITDAYEANGRAAAYEAKREQYEAEINRIDDDIERAEAALKKLRERRAGGKAAIVALGGMPSTFDTAPLEARLRDIEAINSVAGDAKRRDELLARARDCEAAYEALTRKIETRNSDVAEAIERARLPVKGLALGDGAVMLDGLPIEQASGAEQLKVSVAIAMALNPTLRIMLVDEASSLDADSLQAVAAMAAEKDYQVWLVRVAQDGATGFVIEDGRVA